MARSFWKGKYIPINFVNPAYLLNYGLMLRKKDLHPIKNSITSSLENIKLFRRNHVVLPSQRNLLKNLFSYCSVYNGYDFFKPNYAIFSTPNPKINLASAVQTREMNAVHKVKLTKAARIKKAATQKKVISKKPSVKFSSLQKRKAVLNKKFKK